MVSKVRESQLIEKIGLLEGEIEHKSSRIGDYIQTINTQKIEEQQSQKDLSF